MAVHEVVGTVSIVAIIGATLSSVTRSWFAARAARLPNGGAADDARLARIEQAVEAMAVEVERISEGQRFTTRLLAEGRGAGGAARRDGSAAAHTIRGGGL